MQAEAANPEEKPRDPIQLELFPVVSTPNQDRVLAKLIGLYDPRGKFKRQLVDDLKREPCRDCGKRFDPVCMDFDHVKDGKVANISQLVLKGDFRALLAELEKCELVCSNCHRLRTKKRAELKRSLKRSQLTEVQAVPAEKP